jgi:hypothetical protein
MTVMQMITYAASKSNAGGSYWYNNIKSTQKLAKDAVDAINNEWAFAPYGSPSKPISPGFCR